MAEQDVAVRDPVNQVAATLQAWLATLFERPLTDAEKAEASAKADADLIAAENVFRGNMSTSITDYINQRIMEATLRSQSLAIQASSLATSVQARLTTNAQEFQAELKEVDLILTGQKLSDRLLAAQAKIAVRFSIWIGSVEIAVATASLRGLQANVDALTQLRDLVQAAITWVQAHPGVMLATAFNATSPNADADLIARLAAVRAAYVNQYINEKLTEVVQAWVDKFQAMSDAFSAKLAAEVQRVKAVEADASKRVTATVDQLHTMFGNGSEFRSILENLCGRVAPVNGGSNSAGFSVTIKQLQCAVDDINHVKAVIETAVSALGVDAQDFIVTITSAVKRANSYDVVVTAAPNASPGSSYAVVPSLVLTLVTVMAMLQT